MKSVPVVQALLGGRADPNCGMLGGRTPLMLAGKINPSREIVQMLLGAGADVTRVSTTPQPFSSGVTATGQTAMQYAASSAAAPETLQLLHDAGGNVNCHLKLKDADTGEDLGVCSAICDASYEGHAKNVSMLLSLGANPWTPWNKIISLGPMNLKVPWDALDWAMNKKHCDVVKILATHLKSLPAGTARKNLDQRFTNYCTMEVDFEVFQTLMNCGANLAHADDDGDTPLILCVREKLFQCIDVLLAAGAPVNQARGDGLTALHEAAKGGVPSIIERLVKAGADKKAKISSGFFGTTAKDIAKKQNDSRCIRLL
jgi:ankyrin repeat protein